ncbi:serine racemase-like [Prunus avium]|uniref:Serine racemase-like n=1 Tax=Prunus avium TaxID=42229 RepID=A0A6P5U415_PRUAV|nr:serine racemase-like [Prunus avium]
MWLCSGAFKFRGACNVVFSLDDDHAVKGVVTHSSGNHAAALSLAAKLRGIPAYIVIPKNAPKCKVENVIRYGGQLIWSEPTMQSRESTAAKVLQETGAVLLHPYNDRRIIRRWLDIRCGFGCQGHQPCNSSFSC